MLLTKGGSLNASALLAVTRWLLHIVLFDGVTRSGYRIRGSAAVMRAAQLEKAR